MGDNSTRTTTTVPPRGLFRWDGKTRLKSKETNTVDSNCSGGNINGGGSRYPIPWDQQMVSCIEQIPPECNMSVVQANCCFGQPLSNLNGSKTVKLPDCIALTLGGNAKLCSSNKLLASVLKPPIVTALFKMVSISEITTTKKRKEIFHNESTHEKLFQRLLEVISAEKQKNARYRIFHEQLHQQQGEKYLPEFIVRKCQQHNKFIHCDDKKLQALLTFRLGLSTKMGEGVIQYSPENKVSEWTTMFKAGSSHDLNPVDEITGIDAEAQKKFQNTNDIHTGFGMSEEAFASKNDDGSFNMHFTAELGAEGCIGVYSKKIPPSKRYNFLFKVKKNDNSQRTFSTFKRKYYIVCKCDAGHAASKAYTLLVSSHKSVNEAPTLEEFANSSYYKLYLKQCLENARRLGYQFASSLGIGVIKKMSESDWREQCVSQGYHNAPEIRRAFFSGDEKFNQILSDYSTGKRKSSTPMMNLVKNENDDTFESSSSETHQPFIEDSENIVDGVEYHSSSPTNELYTITGDTFQNLMNVSKKENNMSESELEKWFLTATDSEIEEYGKKNHLQKSPLLDIVQKENEFAQPIQHHFQETQLEFCSPCSSESILEPNQQRKSDWITYRTEVNSNLGKPMLALEKYYHFDNVISKIMTLSPNVNGSIGYKNGYRLTRGLESVRSNSFISQNGCLLRINTLQGYIQVELTNFGKAVFGEISEQPLPSRKNNPFSPEYLKRLSIAQTFSKGFFFPLTLGFEGSNSYWTYLSTKDKQVYLENPNFHFIGSKHNKLFTNSIFSINSCDLEQKNCCTWEDCLSEGSEEEEEESQEEEKEGGETNQNNVLYSNIDSIGTKHYGIGQSYSSLYKAGKKDSKVIQPLSEERIGCHLQSPCDCGDDCWCGQQQGCADGHVVAGIELTMANQRKEYLKFLSKKVFLTPDAQLWRHHCSSVGVNFCCMCGKFDCEKHHIREFCQKCPHFNPGHFTYPETTMVNLSETMEEIQKNLFQQLNQVYSPQKLHNFREPLFTWQQLTPVCISSSDTSYFVKT